MQKLPKSFNPSPKLCKPKLIPSKRTSASPSRYTPLHQKTRESLTEKPFSKFSSIFSHKPKITSTLSILATATSSLFYQPDLPCLLNSSSVDLSNRIHSKQTCSPPNYPKRQNSPQRMFISPNDCVSIREASRSKEWVLKAKPEIERMWRKIVCAAHGIEPVNVVFADYKVFVGKGNNAALIRRIMMSRPWWRVVEKKENANFAWTQWKDGNVLEGLRMMGFKPVLKESKGVEVVCSYRAQVAVRVYRSVDLEGLGLGLIRESESYVTMRGEKLHPEQQKVHNRLEFNECLSNKKDLLRIMKNFYSITGKKVFETLPLSFVVSGDNDIEFKNFIRIFNKLELRKQCKSSFKNLWIIKPGEFTNRGQGISVCKSLTEILSLLKSPTSSSFILQKYIEKPLLVHKRKFDIRCYSLMTSFNGVLLGYFYLDGYLRTSSAEYSVRDTKNLLIHLTNDAIQKHSPEYGKFENGNKLSYKDFQKYLDLNLAEKKFNFFGTLLPQIKRIVKETMMAAFLEIDRNKRMHSMEIFGYDFMIDCKFRPWLIEVNTNPCLELSSPYLKILIPAMVENAFKLTVDCMFPPPIGQYLEGCPVNRFELIFHEEADGKNLLKLMEKQ